MAARENSLNGWQFAVAPRESFDKVAFFRSSGMTEALRLRGSVLYGIRQLSDLSGVRQNRPINHDRTMLLDQHFRL